MATIQMELINAKHATLKSIFLSLVLTLLMTERAMEQSAYARHARKVVQESWYQASCLRKIGGAWGHLTVLKGFIWAIKRMSFVLLLHAKRKSICQFCRIVQ